MDAHLSENLPLFRSDSEYLDETGSLSSFPSENDEPGHFDNHSIAAIPSSKKRSTSDAGFSFHAIDSPEEIEHKITPVDEYTWNPDEEKAIHDETTNEDHFSNDTDIEFPEELEAAALNEGNLFEGSKDDRNIADQQGPSTSVRRTAAHRLKVTPKDELSGATSAIMNALKKNRELSHEEAMEVARKTLFSEGVNSRSVESKAFKSVAQVFHKLLHHGLPATSPDAHLKNQDHFYDTDMQRALQVGLSKNNAYKSAILRAGQRSFYFNPKQNAQEAQNQARTGMSAARDYFVFRKGVSTSLLPTINELFPEVMRSRIMS